MSKYRLVDHGYPFKKIMHGRDWVGRVCKHIDGRYMGMIGKSFIVYGSTEREAFEQAVAQHLGYVDVSDLKARNAQVRRQRRAVRTDARYAAQEFLRGNFAPLDKLLAKIK